LTTRGDETELTCSRLVALGPAGSVPLERERPGQLRLRRQVSQGAAEEVEHRVQGPTDEHQSPPPLQASTLPAQPTRSSRNHRSRSPLPARSVPRLCQRRQLRETDYAGGDAQLYDTELITCVGVLVDVSR